MSRIRRVRWIVLTTVLAIVVTTLAVGANAYADQNGGSRCAPHAAGASARPSSWRVVAFRAVGCRAWRHMHHHRSLYRAGS
jgi:hypothetical protein